MKDPAVIDKVRELQLLVGHMNEVVIDLQRAGMRVSLEQKDTGETVPAGAHPLPIKIFVLKHLQQTVSYDDELAQK
jgi:hypothetical protein